MSHSESAAAGWYPDPNRPGELRYWDGQAWTDHFHRPQGVAADGSLPPIGDWLSDTFQVVGSHGLPIFGMALVAGTLSSVAVFLSLRNLVTLEIVDGTLVGADALSGGTFVRLALAMLLSWVVFIVVGLVAARHLTAAHLGRQTPIGEAIGGGIKKTPRAIGYCLAFFLVMLVATVIIAVIGVLLARMIGGFAAVFFLALIPLFIYLMVRYAFTPQAVAVSPSGTNAFAESATVMRDRFWPMFGRLALLAVLLMIALAVLQGVFAAILGQTLAPEPGTTDVVFEDILPTGGDVVLASLAQAIPQAAVTAVGASAFAKLYLDGGGSTDL